MQRNTFKNSVVYQIYPKSFSDSNNDGIGDIRGIINRLDYMESLQVDYIWLTPFFMSPLADNGYDISDYKSVNPVFGTMNDVEELIQKAESKGIGIMLDMVFNHTSTEHIWFQRALAGETKYQEYYIFKEGEKEKPPTNWVSKFGGNAWEYVPSLKKWYLHLFDVSQADLNWENPAVREEMKDIIRFWKKKGVRGFRFDVINLISKPECFLDDVEGDGRKFYSDGPHVHEYLKELVQDTEIGDMITVGEMSSTTLEHCIRYSDPKEKELSMCFHFHHLKVDYKNGNKWEIMNPDYKKLKKLLMEWQLGMQEHDGWNAVFWCNHDQPRIVSRLGDEGLFWKQSAKMLATCIHMLRGTPYIYQGEELGMTNPGYKDIEEYRDVESINYYKILLQKGKKKQEAIDILRRRSRDNARSPMQWDRTAYAGFSSHVPWIEVSPGYTYINVETEEQDPDSILHYYRRLISLRKQYPVIAEGNIEFLCVDEENVFAYQREWKDQSLLAFHNLQGKHTVLSEAVNLDGYHCLICNYPESERKGRLTELKEYESVVFYRERSVHIDGGNHVTCH